MEGGKFVVVVVGLFVLGEGLEYLVKGAGSVFFLEAFVPEDCLDSLDEGLVFY